MSEDDHANQSRIVIGHRPGDRLGIQRFSLAVHDRDVQTLVAGVTGHQTNPQRRFNRGQILTERLIDAPCRRAGEDVANDDQLIREISSRAPGTTIALRVIRDGRQQPFSVKLAERPLRGRAVAEAVPSPALKETSSKGRPNSAPVASMTLLG